MKAVTWHGKRDVRVDTVPDPSIEEPTDAIIEVTSTNICGSDLHLYEVLGAFMHPGDILGHEPMGIVREVGAGVTNLAVGDRVVIPFQISCGTCYMCDRQLYSQCETTQVREQGMGAALFGYSELYGRVPGGQAQYLRVPQAQFTHIKVPDGRGSDSVIDAVGMEAHGSPVARAAQQVTGMLPDAIAKPMMKTVGVDRLNALYSAIDIVRRGGTISLIGVYGGMADPLPMLTLFDKQVQLRMGQANVKKWVDAIMPLLSDDDPLGVDTFASHVLPLDEAPHAYDIFQKKQDGAVKIVLQP